MSGLHLGKLPATYSPKDLRFADYVDLSVLLPKIPTSFGHEGVFAPDGWGMLGNGPDDSVAPGFGGAGDCVFADACHVTEMWTAEAGGAPARFTGKEAIAAYSAVTGYKIGDQSTDRGTDMRAALNWRRTTGLRDADGNVHKIGAFVALEPGNHEHLYAAMYLFGAVSIGIEFPESAMAQFNAGKPWSVVAGAQIDGGHDIPLVARRHRHLECVTWARAQSMTVGFYNKFCDESFAILSPEHLHGGQSPEGFNLAQLQADIASL